MKQQAWADTISALARFVFTTCRLGSIMVSEELGSVGTSLPLPHLCSAAPRRLVELPLFFKCFAVAIADVRQNVSAGDD